MYNCLFDKNCHNERTLDFEYCIKHLETPRGRLHMADVVRRGTLTVPSQIEKALEDAKKLPEEDYQTTALERMMEALDRVLEWETESAEALRQIPQHERRYTDRKGAEQVRTEVLVNERALDRTAKVLASVSKMALNEKMVSLGKAQTELMVRIMMAVIGEMELSRSDVDRARAILLKHFREEAALSSRAEANIANVLAPGAAVSIQGEKVLNA